MCQEDKSPDASRTIFKESRNVAGAACLKAAVGFARGAASPFAESSALAIFSATHSFFVIFFTLFKGIIDIKPRFIPNSAYAKKALSILV